MLDCTRDEKYVSQGFAIYIRVGFVSIDRSDNLRVPRRTSLS